MVFGTGRRQVEKKQERAEDLAREYLASAPAAAAKLMAMKHELQIFGAMLAESRMDAKAVSKEAGRIASRFRKVSDLDVMQYLLPYKKELDGFVKRLGAIQQEADSGSIVQSAAGHRQWLRNKVVEGFLSSSNGFGPATEDLKNNQALYDMLYRRFLEAA